jgi:hypothetical protein
MLRAILVVVVVLVLDLLQLPYRLPSVSDHGTARRIIGLVRNARVTRASRLRRSFALPLYLLFWERNEEAENRKQNSGGRRRGLFDPRSVASIDNVDRRVLNSG